MVVGQQAGDVPDLIFPVGGRGTLAYNGFLMPLDDVILKDLKIPKEDFYSAVLEPWTMRGKIYGFPAQAGIKCYLYRKDFFDEAGVTKFPETWEDFATVTAKLTKKDANGQITRSGFEMGRVPESEQVILHAKQNGIDEYDEEIDGKALVAEPAYLETVTWFLDLQRKQKVAPMTGTATPPGTFSAFAGTAAITYIGPWWVPTVYEKAPEGVADKLAIAAPLMRKKRVGLMNADGTLTLSTKGKNPDASLDFLKTFAKEDHYIAYHTPLARGKWGTFSGRRSIDAKFKWLQGEKLLWDSAFREALEKGWGDDFGGEHVGYNEVRANVWPRTLERALHGLATDDESLKMAAQQMDAITARIKRVKA
jgi:ABC-type glycerol-3-phosphate transport system substrate-binding protein